jgi:hypothetical protein
VTWARRLAPLLLAVVLGAYLLSFHDVGLNLADEGFHLAHALSIERGAVDPASVDRLLKRQAGFLYHAWFWIGGRRDVGTARLLWVLLRIVLALMVLALARRIMPWPLAVAAAVLAAIAVGPWHKTWYPFSAGVMLYVAGRTRGRAVVAGLAGGALLTLHPVGVGGFVVLPVLGFLVLERLIDGSGLRAALRTALLLGASAVAGAAIISTLDAVVLVLTRSADPALIWRGPLSAVQLLSPRHLASTLRYASDWAGQGRLPLGALFPDAGDHLVAGEVLRLLPGLVFLLQPAVLLTAALLLRRSSDRSPVERRLVWRVVVLAAASVIKTAARTDLFHVMHASGPSYILMLYLLWRGARGLSRWRTRRLAQVVATGGLALGGALFPLGHTASVLLSPAEWAASIGGRAEAERSLRLERGGVRLTDRRAAQLEAVVRRIQALTDPADPIFAMPFCPALYFLADRLCVADDEDFPAGLLAVLPGLGLSRPRADERLEHLLRSRRVKVVVQCPGFEQLARGSIPLTSELLRREYVASEELGGTRILRRPRR